VTRTEPPVAEAAPVAETAPVVVINEHIQVLSRSAEERLDELERHATTEAEKAQAATAEQKAKDEADLASRILAGVTERLDKLEAAFAKLTGVEQERTQERTDLGKRLALVETFVTQWQDRRAADMPAARTLSATYRPREQAATPPGAFSTEAAAQATLSALKPK
jgi:hypothetical protein